MTSPSVQLRRFLRSHPALRDALWWVLPALVVGAILRWLLLSYLPYVNWHADSNSYFSCAEHLLKDRHLALDEKRRFVYPLLLAPLAALPGSTLRWVAWFQHGFGLLTLLPLAYCVRKIFFAWRWWIIPVTTIYAALPMILWFEHELLAEAFFFAAFVWTMAGWLAWTGATPARRPRLWWCFYIPFFLLVLTKPAARFIWPGVLFATFVTLGWRWLRLREAICLVVAGVLTMLAGRESQGARLLYTSAFPLTRLDTPKRAEFKAEIRDLVIAARATIDRGEISVDREWKVFLEAPEDQTERPLWQALGKDEKRKAEVCRDLAMEGIFSRPDLFLYIAAQRILLSANPDDFKAIRFDPAFLAGKFAPTYEKYLPENAWRLQNLFGLSHSTPPPPWSTVQAWLAPPGHATAEAFMRSYAEKFGDTIQLVREPEPVNDIQKMRDFAPTMLGWWLLVSLGLALMPGYFRRLGVWVLVAGGYLFGVFLVGSANSRFFAMAWSVLVLALPMPLDMLLRALQRPGPEPIPPDVIPEPVAA